MDLWLLWMIVAVALGVAEMFVGTFYLLWIGLSALAGGLVGLLFPEAVGLQFIVAGVVAVVLTVNTKRLTRRIAETKGYVENPIDGLLGKKGIVLELSETGDLAVVKVGSEVWSATCEEALVKGDHIQVVGGHSTILKVTKEA